LYSFIWPDIVDSAKIVKNINTVSQAVASQNKPSRIVFSNSLSIFTGYHVKIYQTIYGAIK
tara:strand:- start:394 stop:576 length:183 start_codon:yes stop_codon:yes gene_type:complete